MNFLNTFRARLLIILVILLITTLGFQYFLNLRTEKQNKELRETQEQALVAGIALGFIPAEKRCGATRSPHLSVCDL